MKVAYLLNIFPKISETFILNEMLEMQKKGVEVEVFAYKDQKEGLAHLRVGEIKKIHYFFKANAFQMVYAHLYWIFRNPLGYLRAVWLVLRHGDKIRKLFAFRLYDTLQVHQSRPDHIHAHYGAAPWDIATSDLAMVLRCLSGVPYTFTTHGHDIFFTPPTNYVIKSRLAKKHIAVSQYNKRYLAEKFKVHEKDIQVIHCGINFDMISEFQNPQNGSVGNLIVTVARLSVEKGVDILIHACRQLKSEGVNFECVIIGDGAERASLEDLIKEFKLENEVRLLGSQTQEKVFEWLKKAKVKVLSSRSEGIPLTLMEAMAMRIPVIAPDIHGIPELVDNGKSGFLTPPEKPEVLAQKIKELFEKESLQKSFAENGYRKVYEEFNLKTETDKLLALWKAP